MAHHEAGTWNIFTGCDSASNVPALRTLRRLKKPLYVAARVRLTAKSDGEDVFLHFVPDDAAAMKVPKQLAATLKNTQRHNDHAYVEGV